MKEAEKAVIRAAVRAVHEGFTPPSQSALALAVAQLESIGNGGREEGCAEIIES